MLKIILEHIKLKYVITMCGLILTEQIFIALSTAFLALAAQNLSHQKYFIGYILAYLFFSQLPPLVHVFLRYSEARGSFNLYFSFIKKMFLDYAGRPELWSAKKQKNIFLTAIGSELESYLGVVVYVFFDIFGYIINILLNAFVVSILIDVKFTLAFIISTAFSYFTYIVQKRKIDSVVVQEQQVKLNFFAYLLKSWDNVLLRNQSNQKLYFSDLSNQADQNIELAGISAMKSSMTVFLMSITSAIPVYALTIYLIFQHSNEYSIIASLIAILPRQITALGIFRALFQQITNLSVFLTRLENAAINTQLKESSLLNQIDFSKISINGNFYPTWNNFIDMIQQQKTGRMLISGDNGSGKSSLLLLIHSFLEDSFYLPPSSDLEIGESLMDLSTGQKILRQIEFANTQTAKVLLLDEWDANLDSNNKNLISSKLDLLSNDKLIIEVRHQFNYPLN